MSKIKTCISTVSLIILCLFFYSCNKESTCFESSKDAIKDVKERFPTLIYSSKNDVKEVSKRKISIENNSIEINLIEFEGNEDENRILVFKNKYNHYYSIPLFSTIHRDYWEFKNDSILKQFPKVNSTFKKEFSQMLKILKFRNNHDFWKIYVETFENVLMWELIETKDELNKKYNMINLNSNSLLPNENKDYASKRINKNINYLVNSFKKNETYLIYGNGIIVEFDNINNYIFKNQNLIINCYRQDCNMQLRNL